MINNNQQNNKSFINKVADKIVSFFKKIIQFFIGFFKGIYIGIKSFPSKMVKLGKFLAEKWNGFFERFKDGDLGTKLSHIFMGFGNIYHKQIIKGLIFLAIQVGFLFLFFSNPVINRSERVVFDPVTFVPIGTEVIDPGTPLGYKSLINLVTLGTNPGEGASGVRAADNSMLMLLFGVFMIAIIIVMIYAWLANIKSAYKVQKDLENGKKRKTFIEDLKDLLDTRFHILLLLPTLIGVSLFTLIPTIFMILIAFTDWGKGMVAGSQLFSWVGFDNFLAVFESSSEIGLNFIPVLTWTLVWAFFATFTNYIGGILLALLINKHEIKLKKIWRTIFVLTIALPQFITLLAVRQLISTAGPFNELLQSIGILSEPMAFLDRADSVTTARISVLVINLWIGVPYTMLMTSGILMNVPKDTYEAAQIDGATKFQAFRFITVPYIVFVTTPYLITSFIGNITSFNIIYLLTGGGPRGEGYAGGTDLLVTWLFKMTIDQKDYNVGSVIAIFTFIITASATLLTYRRSKAYKEEDTFQ
ncbi:sugar ABC transporter permease [Hujiaoplasma nucleasis]|uniref:Maltose/maltodextrin transport system permease protein n=1 Tax=Hujiaoplasma nucleasis TaxID=2725268 RepID=A0A7L6N0A6_9MOLU|nr:sugar ABC transporter permease [Hujiaoplasma nucleasis]QLY39686.1 sugar ABC transporter permease [Hujiaoplasma nucleasis]